MADVALKIAIIICTFRRPDSLARTLASMVGLEPPLAGEWQVAVVDNGDCADTRRLVAEFRDRLPISLVLAPEPGLARARNAALEAVACDYFIWTDDDVTVAPHWLRAYAAAFAAHPQASFFGGPIVPHFEGNPPSWLLTSLPLIGSVFAAREAGADGTRIAVEALPYGANFALRAQDVRTLRFDPSLGRQPGSWMLSGEESDLLRRLCAQGGFGIWAASAEVTHWIDAARQSVAYLRRYYEGRALGRARLARQAGPDASWHALLRCELAYLRGRFLRRPKLWVPALKQASLLRGTSAAHRERALAHRPGEPRLEAAE
jgi:glycosyltransferase involved in cell wall biosynthesis